MEPLIFIKGLVIGLAMAVPIGPAGIMCIRITLAEGHLRGLVVGFGAATADTLYGSIAAFGLTFVSDLIAKEQFWLRLAGGSLLIYLGIRGIRDRRKDRIVPIGGKGLVRSFASGLLISLTNPVTLFAFVAVFAAVGLGYRLPVLSALLLVIGVLVGSSLWFMTIGFVATSFKSQLEAGGLGWVNRISGVLILLIGAIIMVSMI